MMSVSSCTNSKVADASPALVSTVYLMGRFAVREPVVGREVGLGLKAKLAPFPVFLSLVFGLISVAVHSTSGGVDFDSPPLSCALKDRLSEEMKVCPSVFVRAIVKASGLALEG